MRTTRKRLNGIMMCHDHDHWIWATWTVCSLQTAKTVRFLPDSKEGVTRLVGARLRGKHRACNVVLVALIYCMPGSKCWYYVLLSCSVHCCKLYIVYFCPALRVTFRLSSIITAKVNYCRCGIVRFTHDWHCRVALSVSSYERSHQKSKYK